MWGQGGVMGVPAHDERDFAFATKFGLPIIKVVETSDGDIDLPTTSYGVLVHSDRFNGLTSEEAMTQIPKEFPETMEQTTTSVNS